MIGRFALAVLLMAVGGRAFTENLSMSVNPQLERVGLFSRRVPKVLAISAQVVHFSVNLDHPPWFPYKETVNRLREVMITRSPSLKAHIDNGTWNLALAHQRLMDNYNDVRMQANLVHRQSRARRRAKRSLNAISSFMGWCCGFTTYDDLNTLEARDEILRQKLNQLGKMALDAQNVMLENRAAVNNVSLYLKDVLVPNLVSHYHDDNSTFISLLVAAASAQGTDILLMAERINSVYASCAANRIPLMVVSRDHLRAQVDEVDKMYRPSGLRVAVDAELLYSLEIAECFHEDENTLKIVVKLPLVEVNEPVAFDLTPRAFLYKGEVCQLLPEPLLAVAFQSGDELVDVRLMSSEERALCLPKRICQIPRASDTEDASSLCVRAILEHAQIDVLEQYCALTCKPYKHVLLTKIRDNTYSVVNVNTTLTVRCQHPDPYQRSETITIEPLLVGARRLEIPCHCTLEDQNGKTLVHAVRPCNPDLSSKVIQNVQLPDLWVSGPVDTFTLNSGELDAVRRSEKQKQIDSMTSGLPMMRKPELTRYSDLKSNVMPTTQNEEEGWTSWVPTLPRWLTLPWFAGLTILLLWQYRRLSSLVDRLAVSSLTKI